MTIDSRRRFRRLFALVALIALFATACGSDSASDDSSVSDTAADAADTTTSDSSGETAALEWMTRPDNTEEADVLKALGKETMRVEDLVAAMYGEDIEDDAAKIASGNTLAHLLKLRSDGKVKGQKNFTAT